MKLQEDFARNVAALNGNKNKTRFHFSSHVAALAQELSEPTIRFVQGFGQSSQFRASPRSGHQCKEVGKRSWMRKRFQE